jgi:protein-S-isoprenylcysteine O-methyltransferase Ste14
MEGQAAAGEKEPIMTPEIADAVLWLLWFASWIIAARWSDPAAQRTRSGEAVPYRAATVIGALMLFFGDRGFFPSAWFGDLGLGADWALVLIATLGLVFTWWARIYLGRLWSSAVTRKAGHHIVDTGPYGIVRHPIYTGIITAICATAALKAHAVAILGAFLMTFGFWLKATLEERFLREQLGADAYDAYRRRVPMLLPLGPTSA